MRNIIERGRIERRAAESDKESRGARRDEGQGGSGSIEEGGGGPRVDEEENRDER